MHEDERDPHKFLEAAMQEEKKKRRGNSKYFSVTLLEREKPMRCYRMHMMLKKMELM